MRFKDIKNKADFKCGFEMGKHYAYMKLMDKYNINGKELDELGTSAKKKSRDTKQRTSLLAERAKKLKKVWEIRRQ